MANTMDNAYGLTILSPLKNGHLDAISYGDIIRDRLNDLGVNEKSPLAKVPNTYLCRLFMLDDVFSQSLSAGDFFYTSNAILSLFSDKARMRGLAREEHLKSRYLVMFANFHGDLDTWLTGMWQNANADIRRIWEYCWGFDQVNDAASFIAYVKRCQRDTTLFFNGSTGDPLPEQLKGLYLKQEFTRFAAEHQGLPAAELQQAYQAFIKRVQPANLAGPSWTPGMAHLS